MHIAKPLFQPHDGLAVRREAEMAGLDDARMHGSDGNLVKAWGGPGDGYTWPGSNHGIAIDSKDNVWIGGNGQTDSHILKFTRDGKLLMQIGTPGVGNRAANLDSTRFGRVAKVSFDERANEAFVADGYLNRRVAVIDMTTGKVKRFWGAYGETPSDSAPPGYNPDAPPAQQFRTPVHCAELSHDGTTPRYHANSGSSTDSC